MNHLIKKLNRLLYMVEGHDEHLKLIARIEADLKSKLSPDESESSTKPRSNFSPGKVSYTLNLRDYDLDSNGDNNPKVWKTKIKPGVESILKRYSKQLSELGIEANLVPSEKGWYPIDFEWAGEEDNSINEKEVKELAYDIYWTTKTVVERRGWKLLGVYREGAVKDGYLRLYAVVTGVTEKTFSQQDKDYMAKYKHHNASSVVWDEMVRAKLVGPSLGSRKKFGVDEPRMKGYILYPEAVDDNNKIPSGLVKLL